MGSTPHATPHAHGLNAAVVRQIQAERARQGLTIAEVADRAGPGLSERALSRYLNYERELRLGQLGQIVAALGLTRRQFLERLGLEEGDEQD